LLLHAVRLHAGYSASGLHISLPPSLQLAIKGGDLFSRIRKNNSGIVFCEPSKTGHLAGILMRQKSNPCRECVFWSEGSYGNPGKKIFLSLPVMNSINPQIRERPVYRMD